ncbi:uncharacterized protein HMPREF1541_03359 [Cyphellophora europaea CBS 101466]|uniref:4-oxalocrotonate tautomerase-like domain-containing protein n=1 Tax=Cyphellophora europaea (strain CBS 101466) TaxID=1220924 RepID=W2S0H2_CYPE1|nr:uncharacterized protein HMPREF1541_03359 [Cyphellophora europaea CBS 101466]ETN41424.1 hypothetical protein HMPREF1541_03359 [Cyphellophora europaea CBS 101466]
MPLMYLSYTEGTFTPDALNQVVDQITRDGISLEKLPLTPWVHSTTWVFAREYPRAQVFHGGKSTGARGFVALDINVIQGGYSAATKQELIKRVTDTVGKYGDLPTDEPRRVYVIIREVAESNWGFDGQTIDLEMLRNPPEDLKPL